MNESIQATSNIVPPLPKWVDRRGWVLALGILAQLAISLFFQDFRATFGNASAFAARGAPSAFSAGVGAGPAESSSAPRQFAAITPRTRAPIGAASFGPTPVDAPAAPFAAVSNGPAASTPGTGSVNSFSPPALPDGPGSTPASFRDLPQGPGASFAAETVSPAPEPGEWVMLILGFSLMGWMMHRHRKTTAQAA